MKKYCFPPLLCLILIGSSAALERPKMRPSPYFGNIMGMTYTRVEDLGKHYYGGGSFDENNALIYTASAGYIDLGHLRESADRTRYLTEVCYTNIMAGKSEFSYDIIEPAQYHISLSYPANWNTQDADGKKRIGREISIDMGQYLAHQSTIWHEIVTWYGYASTGLFSEQPSSFSWEDGYSDLLGTKLAADVLKENREDYNQALAELMIRELKNLDPQTPQIAKKATSIIKNKWYSGRIPFLTMKKRNFDVGLTNGQIKPFRIPGICDGASEIPCVVPGLDSLARYGFTMHIQLTPRESERKSVLRIIYPDSKNTTLEPEKHFPIIISHIRQQAIKKYGSEVDKPTL